MAYKKRTERDFQRAVVQVAKLNGWLVFHPFDSRRSAPGYPDLTMVRATDGRLVFAELKVGQRKRTDAQIVWGTALEAVGGNVEYYLWHESDWADISKVLARR